jgi:HSP20 family protein
MTPREIETHSKQEVQNQDKGREQTRPGRYFLPEVDIFESEEGLRLWADMPGVDEKDLEVTLKNGMLTIEGRVSTEMYRNLMPVYTEYNVGNYYRQFVVNEEIDASRIEARIRSGVLEVSLPKAETARPRRIEVKAG